MIIKYDTREVSVETVEACFRALFGEHGRLYYLSQYARKRRTRIKNRRRLADMAAEMILKISEPTEEVKKI